MAKSMGHFRDSRVLSWLSGPRTDAPDEPPLKGPTLYHIRLCKSSSLSFYRYTIKCFVKHASRKRYCWKSHLVYWDVWKLVLVELWRMTGYLLWDWCIFTEILKRTCTNQWRCSYLLIHEGQIFDRFKIFLSIKETRNHRKWPQIAPFCISS